VKVLLDTNIVIHREAATVVDEDIGVLFKWLDNLHYTKCIHPVTIEEIEKHGDPEVIKSFRVKLSSYNVLKTRAPMRGEVHRVVEPLDKTQNDLNDSVLINELYCGRVDLLITEDRLLLNKASLLGIADRVFCDRRLLRKSYRRKPRIGRL